MGLTSFAEHMSNILQINSGWGSGSGLERIKYCWLRLFYSCNMRYLSTLIFLYKCSRAEFFLFHLLVLFDNLAGFVISQCVA